MGVVGGGERGRRGWGREKTLEGDGVCGRSSSQVAAEEADGGISWP